MRRYTAFLFMLLIAGCQGGSSNLPDSAGGHSADGGSSPAAVQLQLSAQEDGANQRIVLTAVQTADLYQIASSILFDAENYEVLSVEAGGGLGMPEDSFFTYNTDSPGQIDFAYTKRFAGRGASGEVSILHLVVRPLQQMRLSDFQLDVEAGRTRLRDSQRRELGILDAAEVQQ